MGRYTLHPEGKVIAVSLLITKDMKEQLIQLAFDSRRNLSSYLRLILEDAITKQTKI